MFATGASIVPFGGFVVNRLDIPIFDTKQELKEAIQFVSSNEIIGFGIE